jgi:hypothetical protein
VATAPAPLCTHHPTSGERRRARRPLRLHPNKPKPGLPGTPGVPGTPLRVEQVKCTPSCDTPPSPAFSRLRDEGRQGSVPPTHMETARAEPDVGGYW